MLDSDSQIQSSFLRGTIDKTSDQFFVCEPSQAMLQMFDRLTSLQMKKGAKLRTLGIRYVQDMPDRRMNE